MFLAVRVAQWTKSKNKAVAVVAASHAQAMPCMNQFPQAVVAMVLQQW
jgi:pheromone shutdown protein TraB